jgi:hypothetical protein
MKQIPGYEGLYSATEDGQIYSHKTHKFLKPVLQVMHNGYYRYQVTLSRPASLMRTEKKSYKIPSLILLTFVGERPEGMDVCHKDGDSSNNSLSNLYYGTRSQNVKDSVKHGTWANQFTYRALEISD